MDKVKLTGAERRVFLQQRSEELRTAAIAATGDPSARASGAPGHTGMVQDQLPGGPQAGKGAATYDRVKRTHFDKALNDPQKPAGDADRLKADKEDELKNVNVQDKAAALMAKKPEPRAPETAAGAKAVLSNEKPLAAPVPVPGVKK